MVYLTWLGTAPVDQVVEQVRLTLTKHRDVLQAGCAVLVPGTRDKRPAEHWFVNRVILTVDSINVVLEKGLPLSPISREEIQQNALNFVASLADKDVKPQDQVTQLTQFVITTMKGRVHAGA